MITYMILLYIVFTPEILTCNVFDSCRKDFLPYINFQYYTSPYVYDTIKYTDDPQKIISRRDFKKDCLTVFYLPGWTENPNDNIESVNTMTNALFTLNCTNIIVVNYYLLVKGDSNLKYASAVFNSSHIGDCLGLYLKNIYPSLLPLNLVRLVSHSMGSQIMSCAAKTFGSGQLRLTALDPATPLYSLIVFFYLNKSDAKFLDVIHTDAGVNGEGGSVGHVDYFPNNGVRIQPYCKILTNNDSKTDFCSHHMSWKYFSDSIVHQKSYLAKRCSMKESLCLKFNPVIIKLPYCKCDQYTNETAYMGWDVDTNLRGDYYSKTSASYPFGLGRQGIE